MIVDALLDVIFALVSAGWALVPTWNVQLGDEPSKFVNSLSQWDNIVPFSELMVISSLLITFFAALVALRVIKLIMDYIAAVIP